jgi:uncharacterized membrane protein YebE (DUF533 family)
MDAEQIIGQLIRGALGGKRKSSRRAQRSLTGRGGLLNSRTLLALGGLAWGLYETATAQRGGPAPAGTPSLPPLPAAAAGARGPAGTASTVPGGVAPAVPAGAVPATVAPPVPDAVAPGLLRVIRLTLSAARADGTLTEAERTSILTQARAAGVEALVAAELDGPVSLEQIVGQVQDASERADLYTLAFTIVRADESVSGAERIYLAQLAHRLALTREDVERLEGEAAARIDAAAGDPDADPAGKE